jgi:hypothetical protein
MFNNFEVAIKHGDLLEVKTAILCEGKLESKINLFESIKAYPNPSKGEFFIVIPSNNKTVKAEVYNVYGQLVVKGDYVVDSGKVLINLSNNSNGIYMIKLYLDEPVTLKLIKE